MLGYLDDVIIVPLGLSLAVRLIPRDVMEECRTRAATSRGPRNRAAGVVIVLVWIALAALAIWLVYKTFV